MTEEDMRAMARAVGAALQPWADAHKLADFRLVAAMWSEDNEVDVFPFVVGASLSEGIEELLDNPDFAASADEKPPVWVDRFDS